jgi:hypothetical protein
VAAPPQLEVEATFEIDRSRRETYDFLIDTRSFPKVDPTLVAFSPEGTMEPGMRGTMRNRRGGMTATTRWRVVTLEPPDRIDVEILGMGYRLVETVTLRDVADGKGTELRVVDRLWGTSWLGNVFVALSRGFLRRDLEARGGRLEHAMKS